MSKNVRRLYVRRSKPSDYAIGFRMAIRLEFYRQKGRPFYVIVRRGGSGEVLEVGPIKRDLRQMFFSRLTIFRRRWTKRRKRRELMSEVGGFRVRASVSVAEPRASVVIKGVSK